jgi:glycosyltransferase involved in cell wall biosynthesis
MSLLHLAMNGITSYTTAPLRLASILGLLVSIVAFIYLIYIIVVTNIFGEPVQGYPTIMVTMLFLGGVQLLSLGILGEYIGRVFNEVKGRPGYFVNSYNGKRKNTGHDKDNSQ